MAHFPKPFFRAARQLWYVQLNGKQINLGADKDAAFTEYHRLMQDRSKAPVAPASEQRLAVVSASNPTAAGRSSRGMCTKATTFNGAKIIGNPQIKTARGQTTCQ